MQVTFSTAEFSAIAQWMLKVTEVTEATTAIVGAEGCRARGLRAVRDQLVRVTEVLRTTPNRGYGANERLVDAYKALGVHFLSPWEDSEIEVVEGLASGRYDRWETAGGEYASSPSLLDLQLLVCHGGIEKARPLLRRLADETDAKYPGSSALARWTAGDPITPEQREAAIATDRALLVLAILFGDRDLTRAQPAFDRHFPPSKRVLGTKPVKTADKLLTQVDAYVRGQLDERVLRKSFEAYFGYCYHHESPSNLSDKEIAVYLYNRLLEPVPPHETWVFLKSCVAPFKRTTRMRFVLDVPQIRDGLARLDEIAATGPFNVERGDREVLVGNL